MWVKLSDYAPPEELRTLTIRPRRTYIRQSDAGYDWAAGRTFMVRDPKSPYHGYFVAVDEAENLRREGYTSVRIEYNLDRFMEVAL